jgi:hypothetical protein
MDSRTSKKIIGKIFFSLLGIGALLALLIFSRELKSGTPTTSTIPSNSAGISFDEDSRILPGPPGIVQALQEGGKIVIRWRGTRTPVKKYLVYRRCDGGLWEEISQVRVRDDNSGDYQAYDRAEKSGCEYSVSAIDPYGKEGQKSEPVKIRTEK